MQEERNTDEEVVAKGRTLQKNLMKKEMVLRAFKEREKNEANGFGSIFKRFVDKTEDLTGRLFEATTEYLEEHPFVILVVGFVLIVVLLVSSVAGSMATVTSGISQVVVSTSFTAKNADILSVEDDYKALEANLQEKVNRIETDYPGYDEYKYNLCEISHNPYELAALLTVLLEDYTQNEAETLLQSVFDAEYSLTVAESVETRTKTETKWHWVTKINEDGEEYQSYESYEEEVEYEYYILTTTLTNKGIQGALNTFGLTEDQLQRYSILLETKGNKPELFGDNPYVTAEVPPEFENYAVPGEYLTDEQFGNMINLARQFIGYPYVWGGSDPSSSFDCSGFVSYVINNCGNGWNYGRLTADGWKNVTARVSEGDVKAGDLIFFQGTYATSGASHVGIVVDPVNKIMIHCGNPIQYASYDTAYWRGHFLCYGRI